MIACPYCSTQNPEGAQYCDECGANLKSTASLVDPNGADTAASPDDMPPISAMPPMVELTPAYAPPVSVPQSEDGEITEFANFADVAGAADEGPQTGFTPTSITSVGVPLPPEQPPAFLSASETSVIGNGAPVAQLNEDGEEEAPKNVHATLTIERGSAVGTIFSLTSEEAYIGRWDADNGIFPDIDLDTHDPEAKVSRRHARIVLKNGVYSLEDLGSTNGTFINRGRRLLPGNANLLNDGDEVIIGKTFMRFSVNKV